MTTLKERITEDMKAAMRASEKERLSTIRMLQAAIKQREVDERITLDDPQVLAIIEKMVKQRKESIVQFEAGGRPDLADKEKSEIAQLQDYLPAQLSEAEVDAHHQGSHRRHRRRVRQGHGQGHGDREIEGRRTCRHGRGERPHQGCPRRLILLARLRCRATSVCFALLSASAQLAWLRALRASGGDRAGFRDLVPGSEEGNIAGNKTRNPALVDCA